MAPMVAGLVRLQRYLASAGVAARRKAEQLITAGRVTVNGKVVTVLGSKIDPARDQVTVDGEAVVALDAFYVLLNKPKGCITAVSDDRGRPTVMDYLPNLPVPVKPVGRLDFYSEGVLLLTNDGELAARLLAPASHIPKTYHVKVRGHVAAAHVDALRSGVALDDGSTTLPAEIEVLPAESRHTWLGITIHEGKHRQIHRMLEALGYKVDKLQRVAFGNLTFHNLRVGDARELNQQELNALRDSVGLDHSTVARGRWRAEREATDIPRRARAKAREEAEVEGQGAWDDEVGERAEQSERPREEARPPGRGSEGRPRPDRPARRDEARPRGRGFEGGPRPDRPARRDEARPRGRGFEGGARSDRPDRRDKAPPRGRGFEGGARSDRPDRRDQAPPRGRGFEGGGRPARRDEAPPRGGPRTAGLGPRPAPRREEARPRGRGFQGGRGPDRREDARPRGRGFEGGRGPDRRDETRPRGRGFEGGPGQDRRKDARPPGRGSERVRRPDETRPRGRGFEGGRGPDRRDETRPRGRGFEGGPGQDRRKDARPPGRGSESGRARGPNEARPRGRGFEAGPGPARREARPSNGPRRPGPRTPGKTSFGSTRPARRGGPRTR